MNPDLSNTLATANTREVTKVAALDLGSNSFHLVVARIVAGSVQIVHRVKQKVRLAAGLDEHNILSQEAIERGLDTLEVMAKSLKGFEPDTVRIVATHTLRRAKNANAFVKAAYAILPYPIEIISGAEEARLIFNGVAHTHHTDGQRLVVDIGGGSTEFTIGTGFNPIICRSLQMGCVSYTKRFFKTDEIKAKYFDKAITAAEQELEIIEDKYRQLGWVECIGTSGTIRVLVGLCQAENGNDASQPITLKQLKQLKTKCIEAGHLNKLPFDAISEDRLPVFCAGLSVLIATFSALKIDALYYSSAALREGVIYELETTLEQGDIRERTASSIVTRYDVDTQQAQLVLNSCMDIFDQVAKSWNIRTPELRSMLGWAAMLHEIGLQINSRGVQRHSAYILQNLDMPGFNQEQQDLLATLVRYHRKKIRDIDSIEFAQYRKRDVYKLMCILRLSVLLNIKRQADVLQNLQVTASKQVLTLTFPSNWLSEHVVIHADLLREQELLKAIDITLAVS